MNPQAISALGYIRVAAISPQGAPADVDGNVGEIISKAKEAYSQGAEIAVFPELCITGYTCADLFRLPALLQGAMSGLIRIREWSSTVPVTLVVGLPLVVSGKLYNAAAVVSNGIVRAVIPKTFLPNSQEYYDQRWFSSGRDAVDETVRIGSEDVPFGTDILLSDADNPDIVFGVEICEDLWSIEPPSGKMAREGAVLILNCSASNDIVGKAEYREDLVRMQSARAYVSYVYASAGVAESTTDMVFGGHCIVAECGEMVAQSGRLNMSGELIIADIDLARCVRERLNATSWSQELSQDLFRIVHAPIARSTKSDVRRKIDPHPFVPVDKGDRAERCSEILELQATGLSLRLKRSKAELMVIGVSGGLDSTLALIVCRMACDKLGWDYRKISAVSMPGLGTSVRTRDNAQAIGTALGADFTTISIVDAVQKHFTDISHNPTETSIVFENAQARERMQILMDLANKHNGLVVGTGDLSEIALGWNTYNADHMSMYNPNSGVPKTLVRHLIAWYADSSPNVSEVLRDILDTPISPELLPTASDGNVLQHTEDMIGPYEVHDFFLYHFVRLHEPVANIAVLACLVFKGTYTPSQLLQWLEIFIKRFVANQFKRSCMPDGVKIGSVSLSPRADWRMPSDASPDLWLNELAPISALLTNQ